MSNQTPKFIISREKLLRPLQLVAGAIERRQTLPILGNIFLSVNENYLTLVGTDLEVEMLGITELDNKVKTFTDITIPGKKLLDICKALPDNNAIEIGEVIGNENIGMSEVEKIKVSVKSGKSNFSLGTLPASDFPRIPEVKSALRIDIKQKVLKKIIDKTSFAVPDQDIRQYLNGMLLEISDGAIRAVASDGHRLAFSSEILATDNNALAQVIIPRKCVAELSRLLDSNDEEIALELSDNYIRIRGSDYIFTSKLIAGKFPNYNRMIPKNGDKQVIVNREELKKAVMRVAILSNELFRNIRFYIRQDLLQLFANNPEQEEAADDVTIKYEGETLEILFNIQYLLDVLNCLESEEILITLKDHESGVLVEEFGKDKSNSLYVLMPIRR